MPTEDDLPTLAPEDAAEADELLRGATQAGRAREALGTHLDALLTTGQLVAVNTPTKHRDGRPRGMAALIPSSPQQQARRPAGFTPQPQSINPAKDHARTEHAHTIAARMVEGDWLTCDAGDGADDGTLHHARLERSQLTALAVHGLAAATPDTVLATACLRLMQAASRPGEVHRRTRPRCWQCCAALGYPEGVGSPSVDGACAGRLEERLDGLEGG